MKNLRITTKPSALDEAIDNALAQLQTVRLDSDEYAAMMDQITQLYKLKEKNTSGDRVSPDTLAIIAANLAGIAMIISYEHVHAVTSKALGFVLRAK